MEAQLLHDVNEVSAILIQTPGKPGDLKSVLQHIAQTAHDSFATDACVILAFNPITGGFIGSQVVGNLHAENEPLHDRPRPKGVTQQVLDKEDGVVLIEDLELEPQYHNPFTHREGFRAFAGLSLQTRHRKRPLGVIYLDFRQPKKFSPAERESYRIFAVQAAFLLQEAWLAHHYEEIARIGQDVNHNLATPDELFQELQRYVNTVLDDSHTLILAIYQPQTKTLEVRLKALEYHLFLNRPLEGACKYVIETQKSLYIPQLSKEKAQLPFQIINISGTEEKESHIFVPLTLRGVSLGVLSIQHSLPEVYGQEDLFVLQLLANYIALAIHNMLLYSSLSQLNETGQLLTRLLESEQTLQATVDKIRDATLADLVVLYPYEASRHCFVLPPSTAGTLLDSTSIQSMSSTRPDDIVERMLHHEKPIFAKNTTVDTGQDGTTHIRQGSFGKRENIRSTAALPLRVGDELVGVLFANFRQPQRFDATQKLFIEGLAHYAAIAIKNAQVFGKLSLRRIHELEILQKIDRELNRSLDLESVLYTLLGLAHEHVPAEEASILLHNPRTYVLETAAAIGRHAEISRKQMISLHESKGITHRVLEEKKPARVNNVHYELPWRDLHFPVAVDTISELDVPLLDGDEVIGVLNFESTREGAFSQEDQDFLITLAGQAVLAIKKAQAYEREKRLVEEGQVLNEISKEIISQLDLNHVFDLILEKALELTRSTTGNLMLYDRERKDLWMAAERGVAQDKKDRRQSLDEGVVGYAVRTKQLLNVDLSQPQWRDMNLDFIPGTCSELVVPMLAGNDLRGVLNVESLSPNNFTESDERLLKGLADLAVVALQNAQAYEREKRLAAEAQILNEISQEITSQLDLNHVFDLILEKALELTHSHMGNLMLYDRDRNDLWMAAERGVAEDNKGKRQKLGQGIVGYIAAKKQLLNVVDVTQQPWNEIFLEYILGTRSELAVPMLAGSDIRGVLNVESPSPNNFNESDERLLQGLADLAVIALQNAQAYEREKRLFAEAQILNEISKEITSQLDLNRVFNLILENALELTHSTLGSLHLYEPHLDELRMVAEHGVAEDKKGQRQKPGQGIVGYVAQHKQLQNIGDVNQHPWNEIYIEFIPGARSELAVPMLAGDELRGVLNIESPIPNKFTEHDQRLLRELADLAVIALQNVERYKEAEREAQRFKLLSQAGQELSKITDLEQLERAYEIVVQFADEQSQSQAVIYSLDETNTELVLKYKSSDRYAPLFERIKLDEGISGQVARERRTIVVRDADNLPPGIGPIKQSDPRMRSLVVTPIMFKDQYYGSLGLRHEAVSHFRRADIVLYEGLAQLLASTIHRLETAKARQEFEQRAVSTEEMGSIGQSAYEVTHRLGNDLGLVESYVGDIQLELESLGVNSRFVSRKLENIVQAVRTVLDLSRDLKQQLANLGATDEAAGEPVIISPRLLLEEMQTHTVPLLPSNIQLYTEIEADVAYIQVIPGSIDDVLRNLIANAIQAMPKGGQLALRARNVGRYVALEVADTGVGIPPEKQSKIFDLFFSTKGSSGFGLWSARRNILKNRGEIKVDSKPDEGTTFILLLPRMNGVIREQHEALLQQPANPGD